MNLQRLLPLALAGLLFGCGSNDERSQWRDVAELGGQSVADAVTVAESDQWRFDVGLEPFNTGETPASCLQAVIADQPLGCIQLDAKNGSKYGFSAATRVGEIRAIWRGNTIDVDATPVDHFVVWSSASPQGRRLDPVTYNDVENLMWIMETGEAPWGYQAIALDGTLLRQSSLVGLPSS